jgi:hypothetical protein
MIELDTGLNGSILLFYIYRDHDYPLVQPADPCGITPALLSPNRVVWTMTMSFSSDDDAARCSTGYLSTYEAAMISDLNEGRRPSAFP